MTPAEKAAVLADVARRMDDEQLAGRLREAARGYLPSADAAAYVAEAATRLDRNRDAYVRATCWVGCERGCIAAPQCIEHPSTAAIMADLAELLGTLGSGNPGHHRYPHDAIEEAIGRVEIERSRINVHVKALKATLEVIGDAYEMASLARITVQNPGIDEDAEAWAGVVADIHKRRVALCEVSP